MSFRLLWGAIGAALMSRQFGFQMAPPLELFKGCIGGTLMGLGAAMAGGCNVGGFYSAVSALSLGGLLMMVGLILGAMLGLKYLYWELNTCPRALPEDLRNLTRDLAGKDTLPGSVRWC